VRVSAGPARPTNMPTNHASMAGILVLCSEALAAYPAFSDELERAVATEGGATTMDIIVNILFLASTLSLSTVTIGVLYLTITQWQNNTDEKKEAMNFATSAQRCVVPSSPRNQGD
jgi:hypothetical protein